MTCTPLSKKHSQEDSNTDFDRLICLAFFLKYVVHLKAVIYPFLSLDCQLFFSVAMLQKKRKCNTLMSALTSTGTEEGI